MHTIRFWQSHLEKIYPNDGMRPDYVMAHIFTRCAEIGRTIIRRDRDISVNSHVIGAMSWCIAMCNQFQIDLQDALITRYPGACTYCFSQPCQCSMTGMRPLNDKGGLLSERYVEEELRSMKGTLLNDSKVTLSFDRVFQEINKTYPLNRALITHGGEAFIVSKLLEEGGELHRAYSKFAQKSGDKDEISVEIADLIGWLSSCWDLECAGVSFNAKFAETHIEGCPACHKNPCICKEYSITPTQEDVIKEIADGLESLKAKGINDKRIDEALDIAKDKSTINSAEKSKSLSDRIKGMAEIVSNASKASDGASNVVSKLFELAHHLSDSL